MVTWRRSKKGPFFLAEQTGAPIIPVAIAGTEELLRKGSVAIHPGSVSLTFLPPINPADFATRDEVMRAVRGAIAKALPPALQPLEMDSVAAV